MRWLCRYMSDILPSIFISFLSSGNHFIPFDVDRILRSGIVCRPNCARSRLVVIRPSASNSEIAEQTDSADAMSAVHLSIQRYKYSRCSVTQSGFYTSSDDWFVQLYTPRAGRGTIVWVD